MQVTCGVLGVGDEATQLTLATGYFNLTEIYCASLLAGRSTVTVLTAHPTANGFLGAAGPAGGIPHAYTAIARAFHQRCSAAGQLHRVGRSVLDTASVTVMYHGQVSLHEYRRPDWTFHAKGLWVAPAPGGPPCLTMVGSPNFGYRSVHRDLETQLTLLTRDPGLQVRYCCAVQ